MPRRALTIGVLLIACFAIGCAGTNAQRVRAPRSRSVVRQSYSPPVVAAQPQPSDQFSTAPRTADQSPNVPEQDEFYPAPDSFGDPFNSEEIPPLPPDVLPPRGHSTDPSRSTDAAPPVFRVAPESKPTPASNTRPAPGATVRELGRGPIAMFHGNAAGPVAAERVAPDEPESLGERRSVVEARYRALFSDR